ncbi:hypothetical protein [Flavobacterium restrictum]|uniref:Uncharacterized protein n=1 Tax=Flavobacterium restrictum TaxID=2594428 RepID=A0A553DZR0_9FLAO|nr:hypothetical protein [Flavobacterium restrictum]TRX38287.1 hypothetical protein FNW21_10985 [Flavobacterium restrictum]
MFKILDKITEIVGWIQIVLSPTLIGIAFGFGIYHKFPNLTGTLIGILIAVIGLIIGIVLATKKFKTTGTINFLSRISATPELDNVEKSQIEKIKRKNKNSH